MLGKPVRNSFGEIVMYVWFLKITEASLSLSFSLAVSPPQKSDLSEFMKTHLINRITASTADPFTTYDYFIGHIIGTFLIFSYHIITLLFQSICKTFIRVQIKHPRILELSMVNRVVTLIAEIIELPCQQMASMTLGYFYRLVRTTGV